MSLHFPRLRRHTQPMTEGSILRHLLAYAIPAILGDLFQVTYNTVDSIIVGKYAGADALAAVGVASPLMSIAMFFIIGMGIGASVLMSEFYGAQDARSLRREFSTTLIISLALSAAIGAGLFLLAGPLLRLVNTPPEILSETTRYLRIVALGMVVTGLYNILAAASRSVGDTRTPLACLVAGSLINVALDLLFVAGLHWGVAGAAGATVISQACAAVLCGWLLYRNEPVFFSETSGDGKPGFRRDFGVDRVLLGRTLRFSYASALQQAGIYVGKLLVQSMVNPLGVHAAAAFTAVNRIDDYALIPERDIGNGETVLVAQNHGAKKPERMQRGLWTAMAIEAIYGAIISVCVFALAEPLMRLFVRQVHHHPGRRCAGAGGLRRMKTAYDIIKKPVLTEASYDAMADRKYTFEVAVDANKTEIKNAIEEIFEGVKVDSVNTMRIQGKIKRQGRYEGRRPERKKAIVTLKKDSKTIEFFEGMAAE